MVVILNFTPVPRLGERIGAPRLSQRDQGEEWEIVLNSDERCYAGSGVGPKRGETFRSVAIPWQRQATSVVVDVPPLGALYLYHGGTEGDV